MRIAILILAFPIILGVGTSTAQPSGIKKDDSSEQVKRTSAGPLLVKRCNDFTLTGKADSKQWESTAWNLLIKLDSGGRNYQSKFKILYSASGIYVFFSGEDSLVTTVYDQDFGNLFRGDVFEAFFHTEPNTPLYLEYEVNPLNKELVLIVPHFNNPYGWIPWHYEDGRRVRKAVNVVGGRMESNSRIRSWNAELFFPFELFKPLENVPPVSGTTWKANFYRLDYDSGNMIKWAWSPVNKSFHEFLKYRQIIFE
ncbi:MAG: carbohydrate-binding family 9-like protein [Chitinophagaceae bacterium]